MSQLSLLPTFPTRPLCSLGCALSRASRRHSIIVPLFLYPEPAAQVTVTGEKAEATGGRPHSGTGGYSSARMTQTVSLYQLQPLAVCPHLKRVHRANLCTDRLPTHPFIVHAN